MDRLHRFASIAFSLFGLAVAVFVLVFPHTGVAEWFLHSATKDGHATPLIPIGLGLLSMIALTITWGNWQLEHKVEDLRQAFVDVGSDAWRHRFVSELNPHLIAVFGPHIDRFFKVINEARSKHQVTIETISLDHHFTESYATVLERFAGESFYATAWARKKYWDCLPDIEKTFRKFLSNRGRMTRVFFVGDQTALTEEEFNVISRHVEVGVEVHLVDSVDANRHGGPKLFLVHAQGHIGWQATTREDETVEIVSVRATVNRDDIGGWLRAWQRLDEIRSEAMSMESLRARRAHA